MAADEAVIPSAVASRDTGRLGKSGELAEVERSGLVQAADHAGSMQFLVVLMAIQ